MCSVFVLSLKFCEKREVSEYVLLEVNILHPNAY